MAKTKSIAIINDILMIGKACYENSTIILKILLIYSEIKTASRCLMKRKNDNMTKDQYFYIDCIIILFGCCLMSTSDPDYKIKTKKTNPKLKINFYLLSIIGHTIFQIGLLIIYFFLIIDNNDNFVIDQNNDYLYSNITTSINSYIFFLNSVQCLSLVFVFNFFSVYKENLFKNRLFNLYFILVLLILSELMSIENYGLGIFNYNLVEFINMRFGGMDSQSSRLILFLFCILSFFLTIAWEYILNLMNSNKFNYCCINKEEEKRNKIEIRRLRTLIAKRRSNSSIFPKKKMNNN
jgi:magnesium-transporting ATPase (P-type)